MLWPSADFGTRNNLKFSTDDNPAKSKTKCMYMCGPAVRNPSYPAPLQLYGKDLPWVTHATHLGHELHQDCTMNMDTRMKRAAFIKSSTDIRIMFNFARPPQILNAISVYSSHFYGSMLWDLYSDSSGQMYRSWNTCVKLVWNLPRSTHNYFVDNLLAEDFPSVRQQILSQYVSFLRRLRRSVSAEVRIMSMIAAADIRSTTGKNCYNIAREFDSNPWATSSIYFKSKYTMYEVAETDSWRLPLLENLLNQRYDLGVCGENTETVQGLIDSMCSS